MIEGARVDLNADIGESLENDRARDLDGLLEYITSGSIACGFHAGDPSLMRRTVRAAARAGVAIGAHPGFADRANFGRLEMNVEPQEIADLVLYQIGALHAVAKAEGQSLQHVKPHGALYNMSARRPDIAEAIAAAVASFDRTLVVMCLPGSELLAAASRLGLRVAAEGFADRSYEADGTLTSRQFDGAVISEPGLAAERAVRMVKQRSIVARDGSSLSLEVDTICVHGDTPGALAIAAAIRHGLNQSGIAVRSLGSSSTVND